jgi:hypothetical protein
MLNSITLETLRQVVATQNARLPEYTPTSPLHKLEARYTLFQFNTILTSTPTNAIHKFLGSFLKCRWNWILNTDAQYCHDFESPANIAAIAIAKALAGKAFPYLLFLMPTLRTINASDYISSSYEDEPCLRESILSSENNHLINILDAIDFSKEDGILKANFLYHGRTEKLTSAEIQRLISRAPEVEATFNAIQEKTVFARYGNTAGAAVQRLIEGLRNGGRGKGYGEFDAGEPADVAIVEFKEYLDTLDKETQKTVLSAGKFDRFSINNPSPELQTIQDSWSYLSRSEKTKYTETHYCVEIIANRLGEILDNNPGLFETVPCHGDQLCVYSNLSLAVQNCDEKMRLAIKTISQHPCYGPEGVNSLFVRWLPQLSHPRNSFNLNVDEIILLIQLSSHYSTINPRSNHSQKGEQALRLIFETVSNRVSATIRENIPLSMRAYLNRILKEEPRALSPSCLSVFSRKRSRDSDASTVSVNLSQSSSR